MDLLCPQAWSVVLFLQQEMDQGSCVPWSLSGRTSTLFTMETSFVSELPQVPESSPEDTTPGCGGTWAPPALLTLCLGTQPPGDLLLNGASHFTGSVRWGFSLVPACLGSFQVLAR